MHVQNFYANIVFLSRNIHFILVMDSLTRNNLAHTSLGLLIVLLAQYIAWNALRGRNDNSKWKWQNVELFATALIALVDVVGTLDLLLPSSRCYQWTPCFQRNIIHELLGVLLLLATMASILVRRFSLIPAVDFGLPVGMLVIGFFLLNHNHEGHDEMPPAEMLEADMHRLCGWALLVAGPLRLLVDFYAEKALNIYALSLTSLGIAFIQSSVMVCSAAVSARLSGENLVLINTLVVLAAGVVWLSASLLSSARRQSPSSSRISSTTADQVPLMEITS